MLDKPKISETETIDKLYLEWSQFTKARTGREYKMFAALLSIERQVNVPHLSHKMKTRLLQLIRTTLQEY